MHAVAGLLGLVVGGIIGEQLGPGVAIATGVIGGLTSFAWLCISELGDLKDVTTAFDAGSPPDATGRARQQL